LVLERAGFERIFASDRKAEDYAKLYQSLLM
jgi:hypothetical protein